LAASSATRRQCGERLLADGDKMPGASFFPDATLNFAENLLKKTGSGDAIVFRRRGQDRRRRHGTNCTS